jgi:hypothetical protein
VYIDKQNLMHTQSKVVSTLAMQSPLPRLLPMSAAEWRAANEGPFQNVLFAKHESMPNLSGDGHVPGLSVYTKMIGTYDEARIDIPRRHPKALMLYKLEMDFGECLAITVHFYRPQASKAYDIGIYLVYQEGKNQPHRVEQHRIAWTSDRTLDTTIASVNHGRNRTLLGLGITSLWAEDNSEPKLLMQLSRLSILPMTALRLATTAFEIYNLNVAAKTDSPSKEKRLVWSWKGKQGSWPHGLPWSGITGPFSHFVVFVDSKQLGVSHSLEFPLIKEDLSFNRTKRTAAFSVQGHFFGGAEVSVPVTASTEVDCSSFK